uniref:Uncharacterized protein n=1 Tax=Neisseria meningitidis alpha522 TaxID=996307 RepID=I4E338_NEIME|nr:hypothetical protein NMALPHA522_0211 [Neisseria meningitidis alpha522]
MSCCAGNFIDMPIRSLLAKCRLNNIFSDGILYGG